MTHELTKVIAVPTHVGQTTIALLPPDTKDGAPIHAMCRLTDKGFIRSAKARLQLTHVDHTYMSNKKIDGKWYGIPTVTAAGYEYCNTVVGVDINPTANVTGDDGKQQLNPYVIRDGLDDIIRVIVRMVGKGRNALGKMLTVDLTLIHDLQIIFAQDMFSKWTGKKDSSSPPRSWGELFPAGSPRPKHLEGAWKSYAIPGGLKLWIDLHDPEVRALTAERINKQKNATAHADTVCRRNILKKFIPFSHLGNDCIVSLVGWMPVEAESLQVQQIVGNALSAQGDTELITCTETVDDPEDLAAVLAGEDDITPGQQPGDIDDTPASVAPSPPKQTTDPDIEELRKEIRLLATQIGSDAEEILGVAGIEGLADVARTSHKATLTEGRDALRQHYEAHKTKPPAASKPVEGSLLPDDEPKSDFIEDQ